MTWISTRCVPPCAAHVPLAALCACYPEALWPVTQPPACPWTAGAYVCALARLHPLLLLGSHVLKVGRLVSFSHLVRRVLLAWGCVLHRRHVMMALSRDYPELLDCQLICT